MNADDLVVGRWGARFRGRHIPCAIGRGGIGPKRGEGDGITPVGIHRIAWVKTRRDRLPCTGDTPIGPRDGWSDDPSDPSYNEPVTLPHRFSSEAMRRADRLYDVVAVLDFNRDPTVAGAGSAIFLHVWRKPRHPTEGCIAFARPDLLHILHGWMPHSRVIVPPV